MAGALGLILIFIFQLIHCTLQLNIDDFSNKIMDHAQQELRSMQKEGESPWPLENKYKTRNILNEKNGK